MIIILAGWIMPNRTIVVIGGALSGPAAAARAREQDRKAHTLLIERNKHISYPLAGLGHFVSGKVPMEKLFTQAPMYFKSIYDIDVWTESAATHIDPEKQVVTVR